MFTAHVQLPTCIQHGSHNNDVLLSTTPLLEKKSVCFIHFSICLSVNKTHKAFPLICQRILTKNYAPFAFVPQLTGTTFCRPCNGTSHCQGHSKLKVYNGHMIIIPIIISITNAATNLFFTVSFCLAEPLFCTEFVRYE